MNFIKLTITNGEKYRINFDYVENYSAVNGETYIFCNGNASDEPYIVKETPEQIDYLVKPRKVKEDEQ